MQVVVYYKANLGKMCLRDCVLMNFTGRRMNLMLAFLKKT